MRKNDPNHLGSCVDSTGVNVDTLAVLFESSKVKIISSEAGWLHISWLVGQQFFHHSTGSFSDLSLMEWFWLIKLFPILGSLLISVNVWFSCPAWSIPQCAIHNVSRTIIFKCLSWSVDIGFILNVLVDSKSLFSAEFSSWNSCSENLTWKFLWVYEWRSESSLAWFIRSMVVRMSEWHCVGAVSSWSSI